MSKESRWTRIGLEHVGAGENCEVQFDFHDGHGKHETVKLTFRDKDEVRREGERKSLETLAERLRGRVEGSVVIAPSTKESSQ